MSFMTDAGICISYDLSDVVGRGCSPSQRPCPIPALQLVLEELAVYKRGLGGNKTWRAVRAGHRNLWVAHLKFVGSIPDWVADICKGFARRCREMVYEEVGYTFQRASNLQQVMDSQQSA